MIRPEDADFHFSRDSHWQWAETLALPFCIPEANINVIVYLVTRPMLGVCMADISMLDRISYLWEEQLYIDNQQHMPCPKSLCDIALPNGLSIKAVDPVKHYRVDYQGIDDTSFSLNYRALHAAYDINDPAMDPLAAARNGPAWDSSWSGHYEMTYRITGHLIVRGKRYAVDCVETGDRSWGPRPERENSSVIWWHASFGEALTCHMFVKHDIAQTAELGALISGYILEDGALHGLVAATGRQEYSKAMPMGVEVSVRDARGKTFDFHYSTTNGCYWAPYPSNTYLQSSMRVVHQGRVGNGVQQMGLSRAYLTRHRDSIPARR
jgi:hypothetical protein